jgi:DNA-binding winged helix-turn-helix (wHTH) protein/TolB-like protein
VSTPEPYIYAFDDFQIDVARRLLLLRGEPVPVKPKVFDTLLYLASHQGRVLEKDELMRSIWPDTTVEENNLNQNVSTLRRALGESRGENRYIVTVPGRGYQFVACVRTIEEPAAETQQGREAAEANTGVSPKPDRSQNMLLLALLGVTIVAGLGTWWWAQKQPAPVRKIAVLPFKPLLMASRDESLEIGMADTLIAKLSNIRNIAVRPLSAVRKYGGQKQDPVVAGRELGVEAILDGQIQKSGNRIRMTTRLVRVSDEKQLWTGQFDEELTDIFTVQDSVSEKVISGLSLELTGKERELLAKRYTNDTQAYELYLKGRFFLSQSSRLM